MIALLRKELRSLMRERRNWLIPALYVSVMGAVIYLYAFTTDWRTPLHDLGQMLTGVVAVLQTIAIVLVAPLVGGAAVAGERERGTLALLLASTAPREAIAIAKAVAATLYVLFVVSASLPVLGLALVFGGPDFATLLGLLCTHLALGAALVCVGLAFSSLVQRTWLAVLASVGFSLALVVLTMAAYAVSEIGHHDMAERSSLASLAILSFNPGFGTFLFLNGSDHPFGPHAWLASFGGLAILTAAGLGVAVLRLRRLDG
jgi:ABC-2 type transport system permease protein